MTSKRSKKFTPKFIARLTSIVSNGLSGNELNNSFGYGKTALRARNDLLRYLTRLGVEEIRIPKHIEALKIWELELE